MTTRTFIAKIYAFRFFDDFILIYPLYAVMFSDYRLSVFQISVLFFAWSLTAFVLEIPSGVLADKYSRKYILIIAQALRAIGYGLWLFFPGFWGFLLGFVLWGIKSALTSGTFEALVYDELKQSEEQRRYAKIIGRAESLGLIAIVLAELSASALSHNGYTLILWLSIAAVILSGLSIALLPSAKKIESTEETNYMAHLKQGLALIKNNSLILKLVLFSGLGLSVGAVDEFYGLFFKDLGLNNAQISLWIAVGSAAGIAGSLVAYRFEKISTNKLVGSLVILGGVLLVASLSKVPIAPIAIAVFTLLYQLIKVIFDAKLQHAIEDRTRATVLSVQGFLSETGALSVFLLFGLISQLSSNASALAVFGVSLVLLALLYKLTTFRRVAR